MNEEQQKIIKDFEKEVESAGFQLSLIDHMNCSYPSKSIVRYEFWLEGHLFDTHIISANTIDELINKGIPEVRERMKTRKPGRFTDKPKQ
jgi:hypothetical protein